MADQPNPNRTRIIRRGRNHSYELDGRKVPGVTTIIDNGVPKNGLVGWAAGEVADFVVNRLSTAKGANGVRIVADDLVEDALEWNATRSRPVKVGNDRLPRLALAEILKNVRYRDSDAAARRGTEVHGLAEKLTNGEEVIAPPEIADHVMAYARFLADWQPRNVITERVAVNRTRHYMGSFDLVADFDGNFVDGPFAGQPIGTMLLDIKTSRSGVYAEAAMQTCAYAHAETILTEDGTAEEPMPNVDRIGAIWVRDDGYDLYVFDVADPQADDASPWLAFLYAKALGEWLDFKNGPAGVIKGEPLTPPVHQ